MQTYFSTFIQAFSSEKIRSLREGSLTSTLFIMLLGKVTVLRMFIIPETKTAHVFGVQNSLNESTEASHCDLSKNANITNYPGKNKQKVMKGLKI